MTSPRNILSTPLGRRTFVGGTAAALASCAIPVGAPVARPFVGRSGTALTLDGRRYRYVGTNMWYAAYLGAEAAYGDRGRLQRELDRIAVLGLTNIRLLGSSEDSPLKNSVTPTFRDRTSAYSETLLKGLDFTLAEMGKRGLRAVIYLTNFWEWSGGMMTYLYWNNGGRFINMNDPAHPWPEFADMSSQFYANRQAVAQYHDYVRAVVTRTNSVTGIRYADDPTIQSWQLANEPRPGGGKEVGLNHLRDYLAWISDTSRLIKSLDSNHLVSTGSEGTQGCLDDDACVINAHSAPSIDYVTAHIWPQNWEWADPKDLAGSWPKVETNTRAYLARQIAIASQLGKPLVVEEFGFPRDSGGFERSASTRWRDRFYGLIFELALDSMRAGGPVAGTNFWAWGGEGRAAHADFAFKPGDSSYLGDPRMSRRDGTACSTAMPRRRTCFAATPRNLAPSPPSGRERIHRHAIRLERRRMTVGNSAQLAVCP
ncbi:mannanase [Sphingomonas rhizophila]|uniref:mannan endo-1,4-beta-mannosidase n=1 Tax=Sphingomonas rhizophila TaxID=2071607 RepID=A0A7G9SBC3_9SPHN|nr:mannanase [Sphingomonas rhizophila]QNN65148.1 mannanase [Sphingomonas rhizophila]